MYECMDHDDVCMYVGLHVCMNAWMHACIYACMSCMHVSMQMCHIHIFYNIELWNCRILCRGTSQAHENVAIEVRRSDEPPLATELS